MRLCSFQGCSRTHKAKGLCDAHYRMSYLGMELRPVRAVQTVCSVVDCTKPHIAKGLCRKHYARVRAHGDPNFVLPPKGCRLKGSDHPRWKDRQITYASAHDRVRSHRGKANEYVCPCGDTAKEWAYDHSDPEPLIGLSRNSRVVYSADVDRYTPMCGVCHRKMDREAGQVSA